jgi:hypothetical protein
MNVLKTNNNVGYHCEDSSTEATKKIYSSR